MEQTAPQEPELPPVSVDVSYRAFELGETLAALNKANRSAGFQAAAATPRRGELAQRYGSQLDERVSDARDNESVHMRVARMHFARASGRNALIGAGYDADTVSDADNRMFNAFLSKYGVGIASAKIRNDAAKHLKKDAAAIRAASKQSEKRTDS